jgi:hypothetical protein
MSVGQKIFADQQSSVAAEEPGTPGRSGLVGCFTLAQAGFESTSLPLCIAEQVGAKRLATKMPQATPPARKGGHGNDGTSQYPGRFIAQQAHFPDPGVVSGRQAKGLGLFPAGAAETLAQNLHPETLLAA